MLTSAISIRGARTHNLANINLDLPRNKLIVITGVSGSGKSSIAFDTIYAEGQRRYVESLSAYARQFLSMMEKPEVDHIDGLSPAIAIQQKTTGHNPRSTVGTVTEIYDYLRVLFARVGVPYCPTHRVQLAAQTISQMADHLLNIPKGTRFLLLAPILQNKKGEHTELLEQLKREGYLRVRWNGKFTTLSELPPLNRNQHHSLEVVVDRLIHQSDIRVRLADSLETTLRLSEGIARIVLLNEQSESKQELVFSSLFACPECKYSLVNLDPRLFSFNNTMGACPDCNGLGVKLTSLSQDSWHGWKTPLISASKNVEKADYEQTESCSTCQGNRLRTEAQHVLIEDYSLTQLTRLPLDELQSFFSRLKLSGQREHIARDLLKEIVNRISFLLNVGLEYLSLSRSTETLSGGEAQRIRLASQIGSGLTGVMYVLDEPSIGLHPRDNTRLLSTLDRLRDLGNTVIVVEHDEEAMRHADYLVDIGPGAGVHGGHIIASGTPEQVMQRSESLTGQYLSKKRRIVVPSMRKPVDSNKLLSLTNITENNLKKVTLQIPVGLMTCVTGVSGSGKSSLINQALYPRVNHYLSNLKLTKDTQDIKGFENLDKIIAVNQQPIGRTPRSNPATYIGLFNLIRDLFASVPEARARGYQSGRFSFNVEGGRCSACEGVGLIKVEMHFLADIYVNCDACQAKRYNRETLEIEYKHKNIYEILSMTVEEAAHFFQPIPAIARKLKTLIEVGLSYITLGQSATTFSGGEAQRIKLAKELSRRDTGKTLYILDEPTTGLHFYDIEQLLKVLHTLRDRGSTIIIIEHNLDVIKTADWVIDLGPEGGKKGGEIIATGTPEAVAAQTHSYTGQHLQAILKYSNQP